MEAPTAAASNFFTPKKVRDVRDSKRVASYEDYKRMRNAFKRWRRTIKLTKDARERAIENWVTALQHWEATMLRKGLASLRQALVLRREAEAAADNHRDAVRLREGLAAFHLNVADKQVARERNALAAQFRADHQIVDAFQRWRAFATGRRLPPLENPLQIRACFRMAGASLGLNFHAVGKVLSDNRLTTGSDFGAGWGGGGEVEGRGVRSMRGVGT